MAVIEDLSKGALGTGIIVGLGALVLAPVVIPVLGGVLRPLARSLVGTGIMIYRQLSEDIAGSVSELVAEAREELEASRAKSVPEPSKRLAPM